ncbi:hypothetical protein M3629_22725 [Paenibacillus polysaccharolyticus]|uniref:hypothetical protein n=1 Tax=Paenibacillus polysaccharolyticus TaxID=582692 RepID=UPI0020426928|nr:hypothetical protein [Paenibacillus polysaccharolyticus]MCM3135598.1 hypothetical protein [Paenibacillus polysaccharolyticus]
MKKMSQRNLIIILALALVASLVANVIGYNSSNGKLEDYLNQQYSQVLSDYESGILSTSDSILSTLKSAIDKKMISKEELLLLYKSYEQLNQNQNQYASYVQIYNSPDGKKAFSLDMTEPITLNYVPGFIYFNSSIAIFEKFLLQSNSTPEIVVTDNLERSLNLAIEIVQLNTAIYKKYINENFAKLSNEEAILTRLHLQKELTISFTKLAELDAELFKLNN